MPRTRGMSVEWGIRPAEYEWFPSFLNNVVDDSTVHDQKSGKNIDTQCKNQTYRQIFHSVQHIIKLVHLTSTDSSQFIQ